MVRQLKRAIQGGIHLPKGAAGLAGYVLVCMAGPDSERISSEVLIVTSYAGVSLEIDGKVYLLIREEDVRGRFLPGTARYDQIIAEFECTQPIAE